MTLAVISLIYAEHVSPACIPWCVQTQEKQIMANSSQQTPILQGKPTKVEGPKQEHFKTETDRQ